MANKRSKINGWTIILFSFLLNFNEVEGQAIDKTFDRGDEISNILVGRSNWEFLVGYSITEAARIHRSTRAKYELSATAQSSLEFGVQRFTALTTNLSLAIGLRLGIVGRNQEYAAPYTEVGYTYPGEYAFNGVLAREKDIFYLAVPVQLEYRSDISDHFMFTAIGGFSIRLSSFNAVISQDKNIMEVNLRGNPKPFVNFNIGPGVGFVLRNNDIFKVGFNINYDPSFIAKGRFFVETQTSYDEGTYAVKGNAIGITAQYLLMGKKRTSSVYK